jgi:hypothetical protein
MAPAAQAASNDVAAATGAAEYIYDDATAGAVDADGTTGAGAAGAAAPSPAMKCSPQWWARVVEDFVSAHRYPPFRWLFITNAFNTCYSTISTLFFIYWFQDDVGFASTDTDSRCFHCPTVGAGSTFTTCPAMPALTLEELPEGVGDYCYLTAGEGSGGAIVRADPAWGLDCRPLERRPRDDHADISVVPHPCDSGLHRLFLGPQENNY